MTACPLLCPLQKGKRSNQDEAGDDSGQAGAIGLHSYSSTKEVVPHRFKGLWVGASFQVFSKKDKRQKLLKRDKCMHLIKINCIPLSNKLILYASRQLINHVKFFSLTWLISSHIWPLLSAQSRLCRPGYLHKKQLLLILV